MNEWYCAAISESGLVAPSPFLTLCCVAETMARATRRPLGARPGVQAITRPLLVL